MKQIKRGNTKQKKKLRKRKHTQPTRSKSITITPLGKAPRYN